MAGFFATVFGSMREQESSTFDGKVAALTGSARGIGRATAELLVAGGAKVVINDLDRDVAEQAASEIDGETVVAAGVNAVAFGFIETRLTAPKTDETTIEVDGRTVQVGVPQQMLSMLTGVIAIARAGTAREAAGGIGFLCSPWSDYVTGQVLNVTGGIPIGMGA
jgi:NAD(P)-dependent dehydrogenase (short-subunit alcohol dehydrogenase family)